MPYKNYKDYIDSDADGLSDDQERKRGTNPKDPDTDHDQLNDYLEVNVYKTDPLDPDTDHDGMSDGQEVRMGRNPKGPGKLKDFFIPHEGNNYKPHALHPKRLVGHALVAVVVKGVLVAFLLSFPIQAWFSPDILKEQSNKIIALTNNIRASLNVHLLNSSQALEKAALAKAEDMLVGEYFAHLSPENKNLQYFLKQYNYNYRVAGENLAMGFNTPEEVVDAWTKSPTHYANMIDEDFNEIGVAMVSGPYQNHETILVAQYFGTLKKQPKVPETEQNVETSQEIENITEELPAEPSQVLSEKEEIAVPLEIPQLISPENNLLFSKSLLSLEISAPNADKIVVLDNGQEVALAKVQNNLAKVDIDFSDGEHNIVIQARRGEERINSPVYILSIDTTGPIIDYDRTEISVNQPVGQESFIVKADAYLSEDTAKAKVIFQNYNIDLNRDNLEENKWSGYLIIPEKDKKVFEVIVPATLIAKDSLGNVTEGDINWETVVPTKAAAVSQYLFLKQNPSENLRPLFEISSIYYKFILGLAILALLLNVFIQIRRQHAHVIVSSLLFIFFIGLLTIF